MRKIHWFILGGCSLFLILLFGCQGQESNSGTAAEKRMVSDTTEVNSEYPGQSTGGLYGKVVYGGHAPKPEKLLVVKDVEVCGKTVRYDERLKVGKGNGIQNAVISLIDVKNGKPLSIMGTEFVLDQRGCRYEPHMLLVPVNTPVQILNDDGILHNIHTFSTTNSPVNLAQPKYLKKLEMAFEHAERISVKCDVHGWMGAWIVVVDHPYYAVTAADGGFTLDDIPPGTYTVTCWHELLGQQTMQVKIDAGASIKLDFTDWKTELP